MSETVEKPARPSWAERRAALADRIDPAKARERHAEVKAIRRARKISRRQAAQARKIEQ